MSDGPEGSQGQHWDGYGSRGKPPARLFAHTSGHVNRGKAIGFDDEIGKGRSLK
jgi:hypothetical protein